MIVKNDAGEDIEVFTQEEVEAKAAEKVAEVAAEKQTAIEALETDKAEKEAELEKLRDKDYNFEQLRKKADGKTGTEDELKKQIEAINQRLDQVSKQPVEDTKADFIKANVGTDKEKLDRFEYYFKRLGVEAKTKEEVTKAATEALVLATNGEYKPNTDSQVFGTGVSKNYRQESSGQVSESAKEIGAALGVTDEDRKKYGKKK